MLGLMVAWTIDMEKHVVLFGNCLCDLHERLFVPVVLSSLSVFFSIYWVCIHLSIDHSITPCVGIYLLFYCYILLP